MLTGNNIQDTLLFPVRDAEARKKLLIACLVTLAGYIIPLIPFLLLYGYSARIMRQVFEKRELSMPEWDDWNGMFVDGLRMGGFYLVITVPLILIMFAAYPIFIISIIGLDSSDENLRLLALVGIFIAIAIFMVTMLVAMVIGVCATPAVCHLVEQRSFSAGFRVNEWWPIFRKNLGGFIVTYLLIMAISYILVFAMQILAITIILLCVLPFLMIAYTAYLMIVQQAFFARAYLEGREKLAAATIPDAS